MNTSMSKEINFCDKMISIIDNRVINKPIPIYFYTNIIENIKPYNNKKEKCNKCSKTSDYQINNIYYCWEHSQYIDYNK